jgi:hypothetical protein
VYSLRRSSGLGAVDLFGQRCVPVSGDPSCPAPAWWMNLWGITDTTVGVPPAPTGSVLTVPPASGPEAQATVDALVNQQLEAQKAANAAGVQSSWIDQVSSDAVAAGQAVTGSFPWLLIGALGLGVFALVAVGGGSARRYGR